MAEPVALAALVLDAALGWPASLHARLGHPVGLFARIIAACERRWNRPDRSEPQRRLLGMLTVLLLLMASGGAGWLVERAIHAALGPSGWPLIALAAWPALAQRSLDDHVRRVLDALRRLDLPEAQVGRGCGIDPFRDHPGLRCDHFRFAAKQQAQRVDAVAAKVHQRPAAKRRIPARLAGLARNGVFHAGLGGHRIADRARVQ